MTEKQMPQIGDVIDMSIDGLPHKTYIVGEVVGVRYHWVMPDMIMVQVKHLDLWIDLDERVTWEVIK